MRVEKEEQTPSAPYWMGCERNVKEYETVKKAPYTDIQSSCNHLRPNIILIDILVLITVILRINALIT